MPEPRPSVGRIVHYVSYGSPVLPDGSQRYPSLCRAAIITDVGVSDDPRVDPGVSLAVLNPTGMLFDPQVYFGAPLGGAHPGGTWHWPERV